MKTSQLLELWVQQQGGMILAFMYTLVCTCLFLKTWMPKLYESLEPLEQFLSAFDEQLVDFMLHKFAYQGLVWSYNSFWGIVVPHKKTQIIKYLVYLYSDGSVQQG